MSLEQIAFQMISLAGDSFASMISAVKKAKEKDFEGARKLMEEAANLLILAHNVHTDLLVAEARGQKNEYSALLIHAQDTLMNSILAETLIKEIIDLYQTR